MESILSITQSFKKEMQQLYGDQLAKVLLYGSYARGDFHEESDIDFMVVLNEEKLQLFKEICKITEVSTTLSLLHNKILATVPTTAQRYEECDSIFYKLVRQEAIEI